MKTKKNVQLIIKGYRKCEARIGFTFVPKKNSNYKLDYRKKYQNKISENNIFINENDYKQALTYILFVNRVFNSLDEMLRKIIWECYFENASHTDTRIELGISSQTLTERKNDALRVFANALRVAVYEE